MRNIYEEDVLKRGLELGFSPFNKTKHGQIIRPIDNGKPVNFITALYLDGSIVESEIYKIDADNVVAWKVDNDWNELSRPFFYDPDKKWASLLDRVFRSGNQYSVIESQTGAIVNVGTIAVFNEGLRYAGVALNIKLPSKRFPEGWIKVLGENGISFTSVLPSAVGWEIVKNFESKCSESKIKIHYCGNGTESNPPGWERTYTEGISKYSVGIKPEKL